MQTDYDACEKRLLVHEGGYVNDPVDPGGPTNFGITLADYRRYINPKGTATSVRLMKQSEAEYIYKAKYWDVMNCDQLTAGVDDMVFDYGIHSGTGRSGKVLRVLVGFSGATSVVSTDVIAAVKKRDPRALIEAIKSERLAFLKSLSTWPKYENGWTTRVDEVEAFSLQLAAGVAAPTIPITPAATNAPQGKGQVPEPTGSKTGGAGAVVVAGGTAAATHLDWVTSHPLDVAIIGVGLLVLAYVVVKMIGAVHHTNQETPMPSAGVVPEAK